MIIMMFFCQKMEPPSIGYNRIPGHWEVSFLAFRELEIRRYCLGACCELVSYYNVQRGL